MWPCTSNRVLSSIVKFWASTKNVWKSHFWDIFRLWQTWLSKYITYPVQTRIFRILIWTMFLKDFIESNPIEIQCFIPSLNPVFSKLVFSNPPRLASYNFWTSGAIGMELVPKWSLWSVDFEYVINWKPPKCNLIPDSTCQVTYIQPHLQIEIICYVCLPSIMNNHQ